MLRLIPCLVCALLLLGSPAGLAAQESPPRSWIFTIGGAGGWGGPSKGMGAHLSNERFDDKNSCFIFCVDYPSVHEQVIQLTLVAGRRVGRRTEVRAVLSSGELGWASGSRSGAHVDRFWSSTTVGALLSVDVFPVLRLGAGPMLGLLRSESGVRATSTTPDSKAQVVRPGLILEAGLRSSARRRLFLDISASYRFLPARSEGPFASKNFLGDPGPDLPPFRANYSSLTLGIGLGVRF